MVVPKSGAPKVTAPDAFGGIQQLTLDTNRPLIQNESLFRFANMVAIPSRGMYSEMLRWPLISATITRLIYHAVSLGIATPIAGLAFLVVVLAPLLVIIGYTGFQLNGTHGAFCFYRLVLIVSGFGLALL